MSGVLSILRSHPVSAAVASAASGVGVSADAAARIADMAAHPEDYALPEWVMKVNTLLEYLRTKEGRVIKRKILATLAVIGGATWIYKRIQMNKARLRKLEKQAELAAAAIAAHQPIPSPSPEAESESLGDRLIHAPSERELIPVAGKSAGEKKSADPNAPSKHKVAVDAIFFRRLGKILQICVPSLYSTEMAYLIILTILLFARTFFSIYIAEMIGTNAQSLVSRKWGRMWRGVKTFAVVTIPASAINASLKYFTEMVSLRFRKRLSEYVHDEYLSGVNFYKACNLGGSERIDNADQRVTADIAAFSEEIASLYSSLLKPLLDVLLFTRKLQQLLGWQGPAVMHCYFLLSGIIKKKIMPNLGKLVARESELEGFYRTAHNRLITNSEEIAFYDGSKKEKVRTHIHNTHKQKHTTNEWPRPLVQNTHTRNVNNTGGHITYIDSPCCLLPASVLFVVWSCIR